MRCSLLALIAVALAEKRLNWMVPMKSDTPVTLPSIRLAWSSVAPPSWPAPVTPRVLPRTVWPCISAVPTSCTPVPLATMTFGRSSDAPTVPSAAAPSSAVFTPTVLPVMVLPASALPAA